MMTWLSGAWAAYARGFVKRSGHPFLWPLGFAATLAVSSVLALGLIDELEYEQAAILRSALVERELQQVLRLTVDVETATRGFEITRDPVFLKPATLALPGIDAGLGRLRALAADSVALAGSLRELEMVVGTRLAHAREAQNDAQAGKPAGIDAMLESRGLQDRVRAVVARIGAGERALRERSTERSAQLRIALKATIILSALLLGTLGWVWFRARRRLYLQDIRKQKRNQRILLKSERRFRAAAQVTNDGVWDWDVVAGTIWRSPSIAALVGLDEAALDASPAAWRRLIHPDDRAAACASYEPLLQGVANEFEASYRVRRADGSYAYVMDKACALHDDSGAVVRIVGGLRDLTAHRRSQQAMMGMAASVPNGDSEAFLLTLMTHLLAAIGADGGAIARPAEREPARMRTVAALVDGKPLGQLDYGLAGSPCAHLDLLDEYIVPDGLANACPDARGLPGLQGRAYAGRRLVATDGRLLGVIFVVFRTPITDQDGLAAVLRVFAARAGAELERMDGAVRMREQAALLHQAREAIVVLGLDLVVKFWSRGAEVMYGVAPQQALGSPVLSCYEDEQAARAALAAVLECGEWRGESAQRRGDGSVLTVDESWTLVRDDGGAPLSILKVGSDVTDKRAAEEQIRSMAYYDVLTGLPNRRLLTDRLRQRIVREERQEHHERHGALLFIDMDNFKILNDTHGHDAGDEFLRQTALRLRACVRAEDTVARLGGDEFVILLDSLDAVAATAIGLARAVGASVVNALRQPVAIGAIEHCSTASIGIVLMRGAQDDVDALLRKADQAMYRAKNGGRNAVVVADEAEHEADHEAEHEAEHQRTAPSDA